jgi:uncharacterized protein DUF5681
MTADEKTDADPKPANTTPEASRDQVGYCKPPRETRFKPGQSGNAKGRPRAARGRKQVVTTVALERHRIQEGEQRRQRSTLELVLLALQTLALAGNVRAHRIYHDYLRWLEPQDPGQSGGFLVVPAPLTKEEWAADLAKFTVEQREFIQRMTKKTAPRTE